MNNKNKRENGITLLGLIIVMAVILVITIVALFICMRAEQNTEKINTMGTINEDVKEKETREPEENEAEVEVENRTESENVTKKQYAVSNKGNIIGKEDSQNEIIKPIKMQIKETERLDGGDDLISINDYKIIVPYTAVEAGYEIIEEDEALRIKVDDGSYECVLLQLSDSYIMPTEQEIEAFAETEEYKAWDEEDIDYDNDEAIEEYYNRYDEMATNYYKSLGYSSKDCPDYVLTGKELDEIVGKYYIDKDDINWGRNGLFPGYYSYNYYNWGKTKTYAIPKYYNDSDFGENTSDFAVYLCMFEYYDTDDVSIRDVTLTTVL